MKCLKTLLLISLMSMTTYAQDYFRSATGRCATPDFDTRMMLYGASDLLAGQDCSATSTNPSSSYDPTTVYEVKVVVHIITNGSTGQISDAMVASQIEILNEDFLALAGSNGAPGTYTGVRFALATVDPSGSATNGITRSDNSSWFNDGGGYYNTLNWDPSRYLNIYTNNGGGNLGYVPSLPANGNGSIVGTAEDRVVILWNTFGRNAPNAPFNLGRTVTHEVGHYLGLDHTFNGGCSSANQPGCYSSGDLICDTLPESSPNYGNCSGANPNSCGDSDPIHNYMDYSDDACMYEFSPEQMRRIRCTLESWRSDLINIPGGNNAPVAAFTSSTNNLDASFTDTSSDSDGSVTAWSWSFGDSTSSSAQNPSHSYAAAGTYTVSLTVTDNDGATNATSATVTVSDGGGSGNELISGVPVNNLEASNPDWLQYFIQVPAGATKLTVTINGGSGDADLYLNYNAEPTLNTYDCRPWIGGNNETCTIDNPSAGTWYVGLQAYSNFSGVTVTATVETGGTGCTPYNDTIGPVSDNSGWQRYTLEVPACASNLTVTISGGSGDADLYVNQGSNPTTSTYDCRPYENGNNETCNFNNPASGTWHIGIRAYSSYSGVTLTVTYD